MIQCSDSDKKIHQSWGGNDGPAELQIEEAATKDVAVEQTGAVDDNAWGGNVATDDAWGAPAPTEDAWGPPAATDDAWGAPPAGDAALPTADNDRNEGRRGGRDRDRDREQEEPDVTLTLDQYLAQQKEKALVIPKLETRKANEGAGDDLWKGALEVTKKDEEENAYFVRKVRIFQSLQQW
jgi:plasminogen activator inhibitor 1 RNA-binding protein